MLSLQLCPQSTLLCCEGTFPVLGKLWTMSPLTVNFLAFATLVHDLNIKLERRKK